jgi:hypothetical protein
VFDIDPPRPPQKRGPCQTAWTLRIIGTGDGGIISEGGVYWINCSGSSSSSECARMRLTPFRRFVIETDVPPDAVLSILADLMEEPRLWRNPFARDRRPYQGRVEGSSFSMSRIILHRNSFLPLVTGAVEPRGAGALVRVRMRPYRVVLAFMTVWLGLAGWMVLKLTFDMLTRQALEPEPLIPLGLFVFGYLMLMVGFASEATNTTELLLRLLKGRLVE